ncbi:hypothetical protein CASFOL_020401 [Castilleja foliolosa]|uniref:Uncharacterized protein n=1 Tax=Castilleja foliolosa TaxID=1961234 RepID=A0ABD3D3H2_9LAMI
MTKDIESQVVIEEKSVVDKVVIDKNDMIMIDVFQFLKSCETLSEKIQVCICVLLLFLMIHITLLMMEVGVIEVIAMDVSESTSWVIVLIGSIIQICLICYFLELNHAAARIINEYEISRGARIYWIVLRIFYLLLTGTGMACQIYIILKFIFFR